MSSGWSPPPHNQPMCHYFQTRGTLSSEISSANTVTTSIMHLLIPLNLISSFVGATIFELDASEMSSLNLKTYKIAFILHYMKFWSTRLLPGICIRICCQINIKIKFCNLGTLSIGTSIRWFCASKSFSSSAKKLILMLKKTEKHEF